MVDGAADLVEHGYNAPLKRIGGGDPGSLEHVGRHVDARGALGTGGLGGLERGDRGANLRLIAVVLGHRVRTLVERRQLERLRALLVRRKNGLLQRLAGSGAHLVHGGEAHAAAGVERHIKARGLKGRGSHAADVFNQIGGLDGAGLGRLDGKARGGGGKRGVVAAGERDGKRLAQACHDGHINGAAVQHVALERGAGGVNGTLAANHAHTTALGHAAGHAALNDVARGGILGGDGGQELVEFVIVAKLQQVALAHGLKQLNAGDGGAATAVIGLETAHVAVGQAAAQHRTHDLAAVVGTLVAHHLVARGAVLIGVRKVAVKAALELALAGGFLVLSHGGSGQHVVNLATVHVDDGVHVIGRLHTALELERCGAGIIQAADELRGIGVARAQRALATGRGERATVLVDQLVGQAAGLGAHAAVGRTTRHGKARKQAQARIAKADGAVAKDLKVHIGRSVVNGGDLIDGELAREGHTVGALLAAPHGPAVVVDVRLGRDVRLDAGHRALDLKE